MISGLLYRFLQCNTNVGSKIYVDIWERWGSNKINKLLKEQIEFVNYLILQRNVTSHKKNICLKSLWSARLLLLQQKKKEKKNNDVCDVEIK